jgi:hypothetical protein
MSARGSDVRGLAECGQCFLAACGLLVAACGGPAGSETNGVGASTFSWRTGAPCPLPRFEAMGAVLDGKLAVMGGFTSNTFALTSRVDTYDPLTDSWGRRADLPGAQTHVGIAVAGETMYAVGGLLNFPLTPWGETWVLDVRSDTYSPGPPLPESRSAMVLALAGRTLFAFGGLGPDGATDATDAFAWDLSGAAWRPAPPMPNPRNHLGGVAVSTRIYAIAGRHGWDETAGDQASVDVYDSSTSSWNALTDIPLARSEIAAATFSDGNRIVVVGGSISGVHPTDSVAVYDIPSNTWRSLPPLPQPRKGAVAALIGHTVIVTTGSPTSVDPDGTTYLGCCLP